LSGIFRDLLPLQTRMLAEAAWKAAPPMNRST
jgi:magnesium chelatase subunit H